MQSSRNTLGKYVNSVGLHLSTVVLVDSTNHLFSTETLEGFLLFVLLFTMSCSLLLLFCVKMLCRTVVGIKVRYCLDSVCAPWHCYMVFVFLLNLET
jgi:hypothetical protein